VLNRAPRKGHRDKDPAMKPVHTEWDPAGVAIRLSICAGVLVLLNMLCHVIWHEDALNLTKYEYVKMLDLDEEAGLGTWFAAMILMFAARLLFVIARDWRAGGDRIHVWWYVLAIGFAYLSLDEVAGFHEFVNAYNENIFKGAEHQDRWWTWYYRWVVLGVGLGFIPFFVRLRPLPGEARLRLPIRTTVLVLLAGAVYLGGVMGIEDLCPKDNPSGLIYNFAWISLEEGMEMAGVILFLYALLDYMRGDKENTVHVRISAEAKGAGQ
jgi:hypothetical protein